MHRYLLVVLATLALAGCYSSTEQSKAPATIVVPQGASVVCPNGSAAVYSAGAYRC
jgi:hypothetical protein